MSNTVETGGYQGPSDAIYTARSMATCEAMWNENEVKPGTFDDLLSAQLMQASTEGRTEVVVLDLGSGEAALIKNVINDTGLEGSKTFKSRQVLSANPQLQVRLVGLTDAKKPEDFLTSEAITPNSSYTIPHPTSRQITAENYRYTITTNQTLGKFLDAAKAPQLDLIVSTSFFFHLEGVVYDNTLLDSARALRSGGGKMLVRGYHSPTRKQTNALAEQVKNTDPNDITKLVELFLDAVVNVQRPLDEAEDEELARKKSLFGALSEKVGEPISLQMDKKVLLIQKGVPQTETPIA